MQKIFTDRRGNIVELDTNLVRRPRSGSFALFQNNDKILMVRAEYSLDVYELPGGGIDEGENIKQALIREVAEETGFKVENYKEKDSFQHEIGFFADENYPNNQFWDYNQSFTLIDASNLDFMHFEGIKDNPEDGKIEWINIDKLSGLQIMATHKPAINKFLNLNI